MPPSVARVAIAMAIGPFCVGLLFMYPAVESSLGVASSQYPYWRATQLAVAVIAVVWLLLWRRSVRWTRSRVAVTTICTGVLLGAPLLQLLPDADGTTTFWYQVFWAARPGLILVSIAFFIAGTAWSWRDRNPRESHAANRGDLDLDRLHSCPNCNYNLRGLREIRCPECGWSQTVDELVAGVRAAVLDPT